MAFFYRDGIFGMANLGQNESGLVTSYGQGGFGSHFFNTLPWNVAVPATTLLPLHMERGSSVFDAIR